MFTVDLCRQHVQCVLAPLERWFVDALNEIPRRERFDQLPIDTLISWTVEIATYYQLSRQSEQFIKKNTELAAELSDWDGVL